MSHSELEFVSAEDVRDRLVPAGDIRDEVAFQNDINGLVRAIDELGAAVLSAWEPAAAPVFPEQHIVLPLLRRRAA